MSKKNFIGLLLIGFSFWLWFCWLVYGPPIPQWFIDNMNNFMGNGLLHFVLAVIFSIPLILGAMVLIWKAYYITVTERIPERIWKEMEEGSRQDRKEMFQKVSKEYHVPISDLEKFAQRASRR